MKFGSGRGVIAARRSALDGRLSLVGGRGTRVVGTLGPIGGVGKTSMATMMANFLFDALPSPGCVFDGNPLESLTRQRLLGGTGRGKLLEFLAAGACQVFCVRAVDFL